MADCPLSMETLPRPLHKHADGASPLPLRMMGAKGLVPAVAPVDLTTLLFVLSFDADPTVRETAARDRRRAARTRSGAWRSAPRG